MNDWQEIDFGGVVSLRVPPDMEPIPGHGIDSVLRRWKGKRMTVTIDHGVFSDPLTGYAGESLYDGRDRSLGGVDARWIAFRDVDGARVEAAHFAALPGALPPLTLWLRATPPGGSDLLREVMASVRFTQVTTSD